MTGKRKTFQPSDIAYILYPFVPLSWLVAMARFHGRLLVLFRRKSAQAINRNLARFLQAEGNPSLAKRAALQFFQFQQVRVLLVNLTQRMDLSRMQALFKFENLDLLDEAIASGKGTFLLLSHYNSVGGFLAVIMLRRMGYDVRVAMPDERDHWAPTYFRSSLYKFSPQPEPVRESMGAFSCQFNIRPIVRALQEGAIVAQTGDGWHSAGFEEVPFLGHKVPFTTGVMGIAVMTGALVVPMFVRGDPPALTFVIADPFSVDGRDQLPVKISNYAAMLETHIRQNPICWQHWEIPDTLETMKSWLNRGLQERYQIN